MEGVRAAMVVADALCFNKIFYESTLCSEISRVEGVELAGLQSKQKVGFQHIFDMVVQLHVPSDKGHN